MRGVAPRGPGEGRLGGVDSEGWTRRGGLGGVGTGGWVWVGGGSSCCQLRRGRGMCGWGAGAAAGARRAGSRSLVVVCVRGRHLPVPVIAEAQHLELLAEPAGQPARSHCDPCAALPCPALPCAALPCRHRHFSNGRIKPPPCPSLSLPPATKWQAEPLGMRTRPADIPPRAATVRHARSSCQPVDVLLGSTPPPPHTHARRRVEPGPSLPTC